MIETYRGMCFPNQEDHMGHMNVMWYISKFDEATWHFFVQFGITPTYIKEKNCGLAAVEQNVKYLSEVHAGALLVVKTKLIEVKDKAVRFRHTMFNAETDNPIATCELVAVHLDLIKRKALPFPNDVREKCEELLASLD